VNVLVLIDMYVWFCGEMFGHLNGYSHFVLLHRALQCNYTTSTNKLHISSINILIYDVFYVFRARGFIFRETVVPTGMVQCVVHASIKAVL